jgi:hypothetical protein
MSLIFRNILEIFDSECKRVIEMVVYGIAKIWYFDCNDGTRRCFKEVPICIRGRGTSKDLVELSVKIEESLLPNPFVPLGDHMDECRQGDRSETH